MKYKNKINFRTDIIKTYFKRNRNINKTQLAKKIGVSRKTLYILLNQYNSNQKLNLNWTGSVNILNWTPKSGHYYYKTLLKLLKISFGVL